MSPEVFFVVVEGTTLNVVCAQQMSSLPVRWKRRQNMIWTTGPARESQRAMCIACCKSKKEQIRRAEVYS